MHVYMYTMICCTQASPKKIVKQRDALRAKLEAALEAARAAQGDKGALAGVEEQLKCV